MNILFLDDSSERHKIFAPKCVGHTLHQAYTADEAIDLLKANLYDLICLDHDLGGPESENQMQEGAKDGRYVARALIEMAASGRTQDAVIWVHSLNRPAACEMCRLMQSAKLNANLYPFAWTKELQNLC